MMDNFHEVETPEKRERRRAAYLQRKRQLREERPRKQKAKANAETKTTRAIEVVELDIEKKSKPIFPRPGYVIDEFSGRERKRLLMDDFRDMESNESKVFRHLHHWVRREGNLKEELISKSAILKGKTKLKKELEVRIKEAQRKAKEARDILEGCEEEGQEEE